MVGVVDRVSTIFSAHPKRQRALKSAIAENQPESVVSKLKDLCRTRWVQRIDALNVFQSLHPSIVACMETICSDGRSQWSADSVTDAQGLQLALTTTDFGHHQFMPEVSASNDFQPSSRGQRYRRVS